MVDWFQRLCASGLGGYIANWIWTLFIGLVDKSQKPFAETILVYQFGYGGQTIVDQEPRPSEYWIHVGTKDPH